MSFQPVRVAVVAGDREDDPRRLLRRVVVGGHRVVDEGELDLAVDRRLARRHAVAAPGAAGDDRRRLRRPERGGLSRAASVAVGWARTKRARSSRGTPRRRSWNSSAAPVKAGSVPAGSRPWSGRWSPSRVQGHPARPAAAAAAGAQLGLGVRAVRPDEAHEVEAARRAQDPGGAPAAGGRGGRAALERAGEVELEHEIVARRERGHGGAQADRCGGERAGFESLPTGE